MVTRAEMDAALQPLWLRLLQMRLTLLELDVDQFNQEHRLGKYAPAPRPEPAYQPNPWGSFFEAFTETLVTMNMSPEERRHHEVMQELARIRRSR